MKSAQKVLISHDEAMQGNNLSQVDTRHCNQSLKSAGIVWTAIWLHASRKYMTIGDDREKQFTEKNRGSECFHGQVGGYGS